MMGGGGAFGALFPVQAKEEVGLSNADVGKLLALTGFIGIDYHAAQRLGRRPLRT